MVPRSCCAAADRESMAAAALARASALVDLLVEEKKSCLDQQGIDVLRFPGDHDVNLAVCLRGVVVLVVQGGQADGGAAEAVLSFGDSCQQGSGVARSPGRQIVVGERQPRLRVLDRVGDGFEGGFSLLCTSGAQVIGHQRTLNGHVLGLDQGHVLEEGLHLSQPAGRPIEVGQRQLGQRRGRLRFDCAFERGLRLVALALAQLDRAQRRVRAGIGGVELDGLVDLLDGPVRIFQAGERVTLEKLRRDVSSDPWLALARHAPWRPRTARPTTETDRP